MRLRGYGAIGMLTTRIASATLPLLAAALLSAPILGQTKGEVTAVEGAVLVVAVRSGPAPVVGDAVSVMRPFDGGRHAAAIGRWRVTEVRGRDVTVRLGGEGFPVVGDEVELSFRVGEDTISVGTWRVSGVRADGAVEAVPAEALASPTTAMDALVQATGSRPGGAGSHGTTPRR